MINNNDIPAFPFTADVGENKTDHLFSMGMSLRDYFAAAALTGFIAKGMSMHASVKHAYDAADLMMARRQEKII